MTWDAVHSRGAVLRAVAHEADRRRDGLLPTDVPGVAETFADELDLVAALQLRWHTRLAGRIERVLSEQPGDLPGAVRVAWRRTADELPGVRALLDACGERSADDPVGAALVKARRKDWLLMAAMAGLASASQPSAVAVGRRLEEQARAAYHPTVPSASQRGDGAAEEERARPASRLKQLLAHLAA